MIDAAQNGHEGFSLATLKVGRWHAVAGRSKGAIGAGALSGFVDGVSGIDDSLPSINPNSTTPLLFGYRGDATEPLDGRVAHVAIWNDWLTNTEILQLAQGASPRQIRPGDLAAYWPLNDYRASGGANDTESGAVNGAMSGAVPLVPGPDVLEARVDMVLPVKRLTYGGATIELPFVSN